MFRALKRSSVFPCLPKVTPWKSATACACGWINTAMNWALSPYDLLTMFEKNGWKVISAQDAFKDPVFKKRPKSLPSGQSLLWALAKESGKYEKELRYPGENDTYEKPKMDALGL